LILLECQILETLIVPSDSFDVFLLFVFGQETSSGRRVGKEEPGDYGRCETDEARGVGDVVEGVLPVKKKRICNDK
jgi:hypothetical protein